MSPYSSEFFSQPSAEDRAHTPGRKLVADPEQIIQIAWKLFEKKGYDSSTMTDIANAAGISRRSLFNYFATKEALLYPGAQGYFAAFKAELDQRPADESLIASCTFCLAKLRSLAQETEAKFDPPSEVLRARLTDSAVRFSRDLWAQSMKQVLADRIGSGTNGEVKAGFVAALVAQAWTEAARIARDSNGKLSTHEAINPVLKSLGELLS